MAILLYVFLISSCTALQTPEAPNTSPLYTKEIIIENLLGPVGLAMLPDGTLFIAEEGNGDRDKSAGVTMITADGKSGRLISGLFSTRDAGDLAGVPLVSVSPDGTTLYTANFGTDHLWALPISAFTNELGQTQIPATPFQPEALGKVMPPLNNVRLTNPFAMTYDAASNPIVSDASQNGIATTNADGTTRFFHRFERIPDPNKASQTVEAVPTGKKNITSPSLAAAPTPPTADNLLLSTCSVISAQFLTV